MARQLPLTKKRVILLTFYAILLLYGCSGNGNSPEERPSESEIPTQTLKILPRDSGIPADAIKISPDMDSYPPQLYSDEWDYPIPLPVQINSAGAEDSPFITPDGRELYFTFVPDVRVPPQKQLIDGVTGLYVATLQDGEWREAERVVLNNDLSLDGCELVQGNVLWFCSVRAGNFREVDMYTAEYMDGKWSNWQNAGEKLNAEIEVGEMHITVDGDVIYFDADRPEGKGGHDIWVTRKVNDDWQIPENVAAVNTEENEIRPFITQDGNELWFSRRYLGSPAVFRSRNLGVEWGEPELIISQFAAEPSLDEQGNIYFAHHFFENGIMLEADIYVAYKRK